ncbi:MAG: hypothetical protein ACWA49_01460 [Ruegeria sp.]
MSDPRIAHHLPLLKSRWDVAQARTFVAAKEECWARDGLGHWAFFADDQYVGWGGFQREGEDWDYGLVLTAEAFGLGARITRKSLAFAQADARIPYVTCLLPLSRRKLAAMKRLGARPIGTIEYQDSRFRKYRLETS